MDCNIVDTSPAFSDHDKTLSLIEKPPASEKISLNICKEPDLTFEEINGAFYFESDALALKGNKEYSNALRSLALLQSVQFKALRDLETLIDKQKEALRDPIKFVENLQKGIDLGLPESINIPKLPTINWDKYTSNLAVVSSNSHKHSTRFKRDIEVKSENQDPDSSLQNDVIRGRVKSDKKTYSFNTLWTAEEQRHLEDLLIKYPPEPVEAKRWKKIADELGNRTPVQVASRVQKYFIKLAKAGLPIPGRMPSISSVRKIGSHKHQRYNRLLFQPSTFMTSYEPPVMMPDDDEDDFSYSENSMNSKFSDNIEYISDEDDVPIDLRDTPEYQEILNLKRLKKQQKYDDEYFKCDSCNLDPIIGTRWHCQNCPDDVSVDLCDKCHTSNFENDIHKVTHCMVPTYAADQLKPGGSYFDRDYSQFSSGDYNYLDINYMPSN